MNMIALGSDHAGHGLKQIIMDYLTGKGIAYRDYGWLGEPDPVDYPIYALAAANAVVSGECEKGIVICGTGIGISLAANKVRGIRCAVCTEPYSALMSREHNDANMLALGARVTGPELAKMIVETWLRGAFQGGVHARRVEMIQTIEKTGSLS
jgi:ribose 5-phosphate isomerase B